MTYGGSLRTDFFKALEGRKTPVQVRVSGRVRITTRAGAGVCKYESAECSDACATIGLTMCAYFIKSC